MSRWGATKHTCSCSGALLLQSRFFLTVNLPITLCVLCSIIPNMLLWVLAYIINDDFPLHFTYRIYRTSSILINQSELEVLYNNYYAGSICSPWSFSAPNCASLCQSLKIVSVNTHTTAYKHIFLLLFLLRSNILAFWKIIYLLHSPQQMWPGVYVNFSRKMLTCQNRLLTHPFLLEPHLTPNLLILVPTLYSYWPLAYVPIMPSQYLLCPS